MRIVQTVVNGIPVVNTYVPQGHKIDSDKYAFKLEWFARIRAYFELHLDPTNPAVWLGDLNVAPEPIDVYHPDRRVNDPDFHIDARNAYKEAVAWGFIDVFRKLHPDRGAVHLLGLLPQCLREQLGMADRPHSGDARWRSVPGSRRGRGAEEGRRRVGPHGGLGRVRRL